jgi:hypothetical protein
MHQLDPAVWQTLPEAQREKLAVLGGLYEDVTMTVRDDAVRVTTSRFHVPMDVTPNGAVRSVIVHPQGEVTLP